MTISTILLILFSILIALGLSFFQYIYKNKFSKTLSYLLFGLRWLSYMCIFLLLINPIFTRNTTEIQKPYLPIYIDNSSSIKHLKADKITEEITQKLSEEKKIQEKFQVQLFQFDESINQIKKLTFNGNNTRIDKVAKHNNQLFRNQHPIILITDGNQTVGEDYTFGFNEKSNVYPVVLGDTTAVFDLKISEINVNKIAFLKNKFPVEIFIQKQGNKSVTAYVSIYDNQTKIFTQSISFNNTENAKSITALIEATKIGTHKYTIKILSNLPEKNTFNNSKSFAVEVIDKRSKIALISAIIHPDLGTLKRSIESNSQQKITLVKPTEQIDFQKYNFYILYQPNTSFLNIFNKIESFKKNTWIITGIQTDYVFLSNQTPEFSFKMGSQKEEYFAEYSTDFLLFAQDNIGFENYPPLENLFGNIKSNTQNSTLLKAKVNGIKLENPILTFTEQNNQRKAFLFGENIWKWRMQSYINDKSFVNFDTFVSKIVQYLNAKNADKPLQIEVENFYNFGEPIEIKAQYFTKNLEFDENANLNIYLQNNTSKQVKTYDFLQKNGYFSTVFNDLPIGKYTYKVVENNSKTIINGSFEILNFSAEQQFVSANLQGLKQVANQTNGQVFAPNQIDILVKKLLKNTTYQPVEKTIIKKTPLIDWILILIILAISLSSEWFIRKYNGLL